MFVVLQKVSKQAPMQVANLADVPEYEVRDEELINCNPDNKLPEVIVVLCGLIALSTSLLH